MTEFISIDVLIVRRDATCDFWGQANQKCLHSPNSQFSDTGNGRDICVTCVEKLHALQYASTREST
jgi:hypothetical protein